MNSIVFCDKIPTTIHGHLVIIDGKSNMTSSDFLHSIWEQLAFPNMENCNWDAYLDWMRDLSWLQSKEETIIVANYESFLSKDSDGTKFFVSDLEEVVFPFWENDAESVFESQDAVKEIAVYCINERKEHSELISTRDVVSAWRQTALNGQKTSHSTSQPVLRTHNGKLSLASFVFFYNREQFQSAMVNRPAMWIVGDLESGKITERFSCADNEFSNAAYERLYNIKPDNTASCGEYYRSSTYALMDIIRDEYIHNGELRSDLYREYIKRIYCTTPKEYQIFYKDLSYIEIVE